MLQTIIYIIFCIIVGIILFAILVGKLLDNGFESREDPEILKKWKAQSQ